MVGSNQGYLAFKIFSTLKIFKIEVCLKGLKKLAPPGIEKSYAGAK